MTTTNYLYDITTGLTSGYTSEKATDSLGNITIKIFDKDGRLKDVKDGEAATSAVYTYYPNGSTESITYPNQTKEKYKYYDNGKLEKLTNKAANGSTIIKTYTYGYDNIGNITSISGSDNISYIYDDLYRLKTYTQNGVTTTYTYDNRNNLKSETRPNYSKTYNYSGDNRLKSVEENINGAMTTTSYEYDLNGNLLKESNGNEYRYDENNKLVYSKVNGLETTYKIGNDNLRESKISNGTITEYSLDESGKVIAEKIDGVATEIIWGDKPLARKVSGTYYYYIFNGHGDVVALIDENGVVKNSYSYDPWGEISNQIETVPNNMKYAGEYYDSENGSYYLRARYYMPNVGRFSQEDSVRDGLNWYVYCGNNPVNRWDPSGHYTLRKDSNGQVYAVIESGDTLSGISKAEVNDANAYKKMNFSGDATKLKVGQMVNITGIYNKKYPINVALANSLPVKGTPNSTGKLYNPDGSVKQERKYGSDGRAEKDTDYNHGGEDNHDFPHEHEWDWEKTPPRQPGVSVPQPCPAPTPSEEQNNQAITGGNAGQAVVGAGVGTVVYWIISESSRILFPPRNLIPVP